MRPQAMKMLLAEIPLSEANAGQSQSDIPYKAISFLQALGIQFPAAAEIINNFMKISAWIKFPPPVSS